MTKNDSFKSTAVNYILNISILILLGVCIYFVFSIFKKPAPEVVSPSTVQQVPDTGITKLSDQRIQLEVKNGSGEQGLALKFTDYLRSNGFDVVDMGNFETSDEEVTIIIDRRGNKSTAEKIASSLGIDKKNIIEQINKELYIDATIVIGKDFKELKPITN